MTDNGKEPPAKKRRLQEVTAYYDDLLVADGSFRCET